MTEDCGGGTSAFSIPRNLQHHHAQHHYEEEEPIFVEHNDEDFIEIKHDHDGDDVWEEEEEEPSLLERGESSSKSTANNRKYTFIMRPKAQTYICDYCSKELRYKSKYIEHLRIHTGERPFSCGFLCGASFTQRGALKQHERIHTGDKPHFCIQCNKSFRTASNLNLHLKTHPSSTDSVIAGFGSALRDPYFGARLDEKLAFEEAAQQQQQQEEEEAAAEEEYLELYDEQQQQSNETNEITHRWHVSHVAQPIVNTSLLSAESELSLARFPDGRLQINDTILEGEYFPLDGITCYYYTLANNEVLTFCYDHAHDTLEIVESGEGETAALEEVIPAEIQVPHYEEHYEAPAEAFEVYEEVLRDNTVAEPSTAEYEEIYVGSNDPEKAKEDPTLQYIIDPVHVIDVEHTDELQNSKELITVVGAPVELDPESAAVNKAFYPPTRRKYRKPKNLEWIINAVASGKKLEDATPHKRKKPTIKDCEICGLTLKYPSKIAAHMRTHTGERPYVCEICGKGFAMNTTLRMHVRRHLKQKLFRCTYPNCTKSFVSGALLNFHVQNRHFTRRKFACLRGCGLTFYSNKERERHEKICLPSMIHEDDDDNLEYEEFVNPHTGETEKWVFNGYVSEDNSWENNNNMDNAIGDDNVQIIGEDEAPY